MQDTYRAFAPESHVIDHLNGCEIENYNGRIWLIGRGACYDYLMSLGDCWERSSKTVFIEYHNSSFEIILIEKGQCG